MYQVPSAVWNEIAQREALSQPWARLFRLDDEELPIALQPLQDAMQAEGIANSVIVAFFLVAPLLQENVAISNFIVKTEQGWLRKVLPELLSVEEAVWLADLEYRLDPSEQMQLHGLLDAMLAKSKDHNELPQHLPEMRLSSLHSEALIDIDNALADLKCLFKLDGG